jgi:hypothetical protein
MYGDDFTSENDNLQQLKALGSFPWNEFLNWKVWQFTGDSRYTWGSRPCESPRIIKTRKAENITIVIFMLNWCQNSLMLSLIICITFPDKPGEVSKHVFSFKIWPRIGYWCSSWYGNKTADSEALYSKVPGSIPTVVIINTKKCQYNDNLKTGVEPPPETSCISNRPIPQTTDNVQHSVPIKWIPIYSCVKVLVCIRNKYVWFVT